MLFYRISYHRVPMPGDCQAISVQRKSIPAFFGIKYERNQGTPMPFLIPNRLYRSASYHAMFGCRQPSFPDIPRRPTQVCDISAKRHHLVVRVADWMGRWMVQCSHPNLRGRYFYGFGFRDFVYFCGGGARNTRRETLDGNG